MRIHSDFFNYFLNPDITLKNVTDPSRLFAFFVGFVAIRLARFGIIVILTPFRNNNFIDVIDKEIQKFMSVLLHVIIEIH